MKEAKITRTLEEDVKLGKFSKIVFPDGSRVYITKQGWTLVAPEKHFKKDLKKAKEWGKIELTIPFSEINVALKETKELGYVQNSQSITKSSTLENVKNRKV